MLLGDSLGSHVCIRIYSADDAVSAESGDESSAVSVASYRHPTDKNEFLFKCTELVKLIESGLDLFKTVNNRFESKY